MWTLTQFKAHLQIQSAKTGNTVSYEDDYLPQIEEIIRLTILAVHNKITWRKGSIGLYGFDIIADKSGKLWLLEVNKCPTMEMTTDITKQLVPEFMRSLIALLVDENTAGFHQII